MKCFLIIFKIWFQLGNLTCFCRFWWVQDIWMHDMEKISKQEKSAGKEDGAQSMVLLVELVRVSTQSRQSLRWLVHWSPRIPRKKEDELRWGQGGGAHLSHPSPHLAWPGPCYCTDCNVSWKVVTFSDRSSLRICLVTFKIWSWFVLIFPCSVVWMDWSPPYICLP